jgi:hypothetical protein
MLGLGAVPALRAQACMSAVHGVGRRGELCMAHEEARWQERTEFTATVVLRPAREADQEEAAWALPVSRAAVLPLYGRQRTHALLPRRPGSRTGTTERVNACVIHTHTHTHTLAGRSGIDLENK